MEDRLEPLRQKVEQKREEMNRRALELYEQTGKLSSPDLCQRSHAFTDLAYEYQTLLKQKEQDAQDEKR